jgi:hypothetical protein
MKNFLLAFSLLALFAINAQAQCTPNPFSGGLSNPSDSIPPAVATDFYSQIIHIRIPDDTIIAPLVFPVTIDSAGILGVNNLPQGLSYQTNAPNDIWPGDTFGCVIVQGIPLTADTGAHNVDIEFIVYGLGQAATNIMTYKFHILDSTHLGFDDLNVDQFALKQNIPNPTNGSTQIDFLVNNPSDFIFEVYNLQGQRVHYRSIHARSGVNTFMLDTESYPAGVYVYRLTNGNIVESKRMIVQ